MLGILTPYERNPTSYAAIALADTVVTLGEQVSVRATDDVANLGTKWDNLVYGTGSIKDWIDSCDRVVWFGNSHNIWGLADFHTASIGVLRADAIGHAVVSSNELCNNNGLLLFNEDSVNRLAGAYLPEEILFSTAWSPSDPIVRKQRNDKFKNNILVYIQNGSINHISKAVDLIKNIRVQDKGINCELLIADRINGRLYNIVKTVSKLGVPFKLKANKSDRLKAYSRNDRMVYLFNVDDSAFIPLEALHYGLRVSILDSEAALLIMTCPGVDVIPSSKTAAVVGLIDLHTFKPDLASENVLAHIDSDRYLTCDAAYDWLLKRKSAFVKYWKWLLDVPGR